MHALRQAGERDGAHQQTEVAQRDVVEAGHGDQVENDAGQPGRHDPGADTRRDRDQHAGRDLDHSHDVHALVGATGKQMV